VLGASSRNDGALKEVLLDGSAHSARHRSTHHLQLRSAPDRILSVSSGNFRSCSGAFVRPGSPVVVALVSGPGVTSPKNRSSGCETGHAGFKSFLFVLPGSR
jgi:hypothetical protein